MTTARWDIQAVDHSKLGYILLYCPSLCLVYNWCTLFRKKKHGKKKHSEKDPESLPTIPGSPQAVSEEDEEEEEHTRSPTKKKGHPVKFYIDDDGPEEKESLIKPPQIVVDPPSDIGNMSSPDNEDTKV